MSLMFSLKATAFISCNYFVFTSKITHNCASAVATYCVLPGMPSCGDGQD